MKLALLNKIFVVMAILSIVSLFILWMVVHPRYKAAVIDERISIIQQLQNYSIEHLDRTIISWSNIARFIAGQVIDRPKEGELILQTMMTLHPEIIQVKIHSTKLSDELISQNTSYHKLNLRINDSVWVRSKLDSTLSIAWLNQAASPQQLLLTQLQFQVQNNPFILTVVWDATQLNNILTRMPLGQDYSMSIHSPSAVVIHNTSSFKMFRTPDAIEKMSTYQSIREGTITWRILRGAFQSCQLWMIIAVPEETIIESAGALMLYSISFIVGLLAIVLILCWLLSRRISRFIDKMNADTIELHEP